MKTREQVTEEVLALPQKHVLLALPTGFGKSLLALRRIFSKDVSSVLIVYPKINLKQNWIREFEKWGYADKLPNVSFTTYASLEKHADKHWDCICLDEAHHVTDRVLYILQSISFDRSVLLSATINANIRYKLGIVMPGLKTYNVRLVDAICDEVLPEPKIVLIPLTLKHGKRTEQIVKNPKVQSPVLRAVYEERFRCKDKHVRYIIACSEFEYIQDLDQQIDWCKSKAMEGNEIMKNVWLHKAGERLKWLASKKTECVAKILAILDGERTLTFCGSIEQTKLLGSHCIHSKNKLSTKELEAFNAGKIRHITTCTMLDAGCNLYDCRVGIFANINASDRIQTQRIGRLLRHASPLLVIPYFKNTREEEIVNKMIEGFNPDSIITVTCKKELLDVL
jgi:superfamily II DNA or RNA helicase